MNDQLRLTLGVRDRASFDNFITAAADDDNAAAREHLRRLRGVAGEPAVYLWGPAGSGRTHLLQALCQAAGERQQAAVCLSMRGEPGLPPQALEGMERLGIVCIDDLDAILGERRWERALATLCVGVQALGGGLVVSAGMPPAALAAAAPALGERFAAAHVFELRPADAALRRAMLLARAERRGLRLPEAVAAHLLDSCGHDLRRLFATLDALERSLLASPRKPGLALLRRLLRETPAS